MPAEVVMEAEKWGRKLEPLTVRVVAVLAVTEEGALFLEKLWNQFLCLCTSSLCWLLVCVGEEHGGEEQGGEELGGEEQGGEVEEISCGSCVALPTSDAWQVPPPY